jgi:class 3 adenylate cyclase
MDIVVWLRSLGLGKYEAIFRENEIDESVLPDLTTEDLKELGVTALGHRRKLLAAIAALRADVSGKAPSVDAGTTSSARSAPPEDRAERRQVTVMFSDLVGSTALSAHMDPEDLREVISAYQKCVAETVQRFGGFVAKFMGDGVLIYFGYPQAHEDDAEQAVRAGLELAAAVTALKTHAPLQTRVGIATGLVVVGDLIGSGASQEQAIVGETPNLAARLQAVAEPNSVVIAEGTRKLVGNLFEVQDLGAQNLKGISGLVPAWAALRPASVESRFDAFHATGLTELVGREEELELVTYRPDFEPPWIGEPHVTALTLNRLTGREIGAMVEDVLGNISLPSSIQKEIIERTDGIPLFVEEITKSVLEAIGEDATERMGAGFGSPSITIPTSLHASLMARLDRLGAAKEVAQIGAAMGREFTHALLAAVVHKPEQELEPALDRIIRASLLFRQGVPPQASYLFKHALVQDAAYGTLLREPRRALHARIADTLEKDFPDIAENQPEILARHCTEAGLIEKAASLWGKAGQRSLARSALAEAAKQLSRALEQIATLPATPTLRKEQIRLQVALIHPLFHIRGFAAPETKAAAEQARLLIEKAEALGEPLEDPLLLFSVLFGFWVANYLAFNGDVMRDLATQFLTLAKRQETKIPQMMGHHVMGISLAATGDLVHGLTHFDRSVALYDPEQHRPLATRFGQTLEWPM